MSIILHHLDGSIDGKEEHRFDDSFESILLGRSSSADVKFPPQNDTIGGKDLQIVRTLSGNYELRRLGHYYLEIDGHPVPTDQNNIPIGSGSIIRLGGKKGPSFRVEVNRERRTGPNVTAKTGQYEEVAPVYQQLPGLRKIAGYGALAASVLFAAFVGYTVVQDQSFSARIDEAELRDANIAHNQFNDPNVIKSLEAAVYLVVDEAGAPIGTAWAFDDYHLATNAHVVNGIKNKGGGYLKGHGMDGREIVKTTTHPGHDKFAEFADNLGKDSRTIFERISLASTYDVAILEIGEGAPLPDKLEVASNEELFNLSPGDAIAYAGFPIENMQGADVSVKDPEPQVKFGHISSLTDVFMCRSLDPEATLLIQHSIPATGGASGSPIIGTDGKVIAIFSGGNINKTEEGRTPNAALINFAQRADLLEELMAGEDNAEKEIAEDEGYWDQRAADLKLDTYLDFELNVLRRDMRYRYKVDGNGEPITNTTDSLRSWTAGLMTRPTEDESFTFEAEPGYLYAFLAQSNGSQNPGLGIDFRAGGETLDKQSKTGNVSGQFLDPAAWLTVDTPTKVSVVVWAEVQGEADYTLYGLKWKLPPPKGTASAAP